MNWFTAKLAGIFLVGTTSSAFACVALPDAIPQIEDAKTALSDGKFYEGLSVIGGITVSQTEIRQTSQQLESQFPGGFDHCETVYVQTASPKFRAELVMLGAKEKDLIYLYLQVVNFNGRWEVINFRLTDNYAEIADKLG